MKRLIAACFLLLILTACSYPARSTPILKPTAVPTRSATAAQLPTITSLPLSETPMVGADWNGIPIMPGEIAGEGDETGYVFTIRATPQQVQEYYRLELEKLGWQPVPQSDGEASMTLVYINNTGETLTVSMLAKEDQVLVLLAK